MTYLLTLDPGYKKAGAALFGGGDLIYAALIEISEPDRDLARHWSDMAWAIERAIWDYTEPYYNYAAAVELMQIDGRTGKAQAAELLRLSGMAGAICALATGEVAGYPPSEWNKNRGKGPNHAKILRALSDEEKTTFLEGEKITDGKRKNLCGSLRPKIGHPDQLYSRAVDERTGQAEHVLDAVGIGLYHLGRLR